MKIPSSISLRSGWILAWAIAATTAFADQRPNIIYIMGDDMGFSDLGCYGSEIDTPHLDSLAENGIRFTQFYNTARCCPTRASLLTGLYPHQAGIGHMMEDRGHDGYRGELNRRCVTIPEVLRSADYRCYMSGKWHVTSKVKVTDMKDKSNWPLQRGFDRFYGTIHGAGSFWDPNSLTRGNDFVSPFDDPEYPRRAQPTGKPTSANDDKEVFYYTDAISDHAVRFIQDHEAQSGDQPFFLYVSYTAAHWPMHARESDIGKYAGRYDDGYAAIRKQRLENMIRLGVLEKDSVTDWEIPSSWTNRDHWEWDRRCMEVYAAMIDNMDQGIGKIINALSQTEQLDDTLICFFQDNGGCAEPFGRGKRHHENSQTRAEHPSLAPLAKDFLQPDMQPKQTRDGYPVRTGHLAMAGPADTYLGYGKTWATVSNTPFREYKHWVHEGGISTPLIVHWPSVVDRRGEFETMPSHLIDLMATAVDVAGASYPENYHDGQEIQPMEGVSLLPLFTHAQSSNKPIRREAIYWEHEGNRAIRVGDEKLVAMGAKGKWELYDIKHDRSEQNNLASERPKRVKELAAMWESYAERAQVYPLKPPRSQSH